MDEVLGDNEDVAEVEEGVKEFDITLKQWEFNPAEIVVKKGDKVKLTLTSEDVAHGFAIGEYKINEKVEPGETKVIEFDATMSGKFLYYCSVPCGSGHSTMKGWLTVE